MDFNYRDIVKNPPDVEEIFKLASLGDFPVSYLVNKNSKNFKDLQKDADEMSEQEIAEMLSNNPKIMRRPLFADGKSLVIGFKPEDLEEILT